MGAPSVGSDGLGSMLARPALSARLATGTATRDNPDGLSFGGKYGRHHQGKSDPLETRGGTEKYLRRACHPQNRSILRRWRGARSSVGGEPMKRIMKFKFLKSNDLMITIECEHGSLISMNWTGEDDLVAVRYMVNELKNDKRVSRVFDIEYEEDEDEQ